MVGNIVGEKAEFSTLKFVIYGEKTDIPCD